jgi:hypothetical protein
MFTNKVTVKIRKDKKYLQYIQIVRRYDNSLTMAQIKDAMEKGEVVFCFDPNNNPIINNGADNSILSLSDYFLNTLRLLKKAGADMTVLERNRECVEFSKVSSSKENIERLIAELFEAKDGTEAFNAIDKLKKTAKKRESVRAEITDALMKFSKETQFSHLKSLVIPTINDIVYEGERKYEEFYKTKIEQGDYSEAYYAIEGYTKVMQKASYDYLVDVLLSRKLNMECEALIVCELSHLSNQPFDSGSPYDKPEWSESDLKLPEIVKWKNDGYPDGIGYVEPSVHRCLKKPITPSEKVYAALNERLKKRREESDKAHPTFWLINADESDIALIKKQLNPPLDYLDFLTKASPLNVEINLKDYGMIHLLGAQELIEGQVGYSHILEDNRKDEEWPENYIVIATCNADPFCIDASQVNSPVYYAVHGMDEWDFEEAFPSFMHFLKALK